MGCWPIATQPKYSGLMSNSKSRLTTRPTSSSTSRARLSAFAPPAQGLWALSAFNRTSFRARSTSDASSASRRAGHCRRLSRQRLHRDAAGAAGGHQSGAGSGHHALCRRGRRPHGRAPPRQPAAAQPVYNYLHDLPDMGRRPSGCCRAGYFAHGRSLAGFDAGRGCPFQCSFCTIINVQGRKSPYRGADEVEALVRETRPGRTRSSSATTILLATRTGSRFLTA